MVCYINGLPLLSVKFVNNLYRVNLSVDRRIKQEKQRSYFDGETSMVDGTTESGNFHVAAQ